MARVTVEDCVQKIPNRFDLVLLAAHRSRLLVTDDAGARDQNRSRREKEPTRALREIARKDADTEAMREEYIVSLQKLRSGDNAERDADRYAAESSQQISEEDALKAYQAESDAVHSSRR